MQDAQSHCKYKWDVFQFKSTFTIFRLTVGAFETLRLVAIVVTMCIKFILMPWYLQAYLDMAYHRTEEQKKEAGRITNIEYQKKVTICCISVAGYI